MTIARRKSTTAARLTQLRKELARISTPTDALDVAKRAMRAKKVYEAIEESVEVCNEFAEVYLLAYWKFGEFVEGIERGRPRKTIIDNGFPGTPNQRENGRRFKRGVKASDIPEYKQVATQNLESASIAGCLEWVDPGRHGNLKGEYEWYTPATILEAARAVMGGIDLDPASCEEANVLVQATQIFTEDDDGLERQWFGRVFLNPPFAHPTVKYFADKLLAEFAGESVDQAIWLSNACIDTDWWQSLATHGLVCCHRGRVRFYGPNDQGQSPTLGQTIIYLGPAVEAFRAQFGAFGVVLS